MKLTKFALSSLVALAVVASAAVAVAEGEAMAPAADAMAAPEAAADADMVAIAAMTPEQKVAARIAAMKEDGGILKGAMNLTGAEAVAAADKLIHNFTHFPAMFTPDTNGVGGTEAKPEIWSNLDAFNAIFAKSIEGAVAMKAAAEAGDAAAYGAAFKAVAGTCGECHQAWRS